MDGFAPLCPQGRMPSGSTHARSASRTSPADRGSLQWDVRRCRGHIRHRGLRLTSGVTVWAAEHAEVRPALSFDRRTASPTP